MSISAYIVGLMYLGTDAPMFLLMAQPEPNDMQPCVSWVQIKKTAPSWDEAEYSVCEAMDRDPRFCRLDPMSNERSWRLASYEEFCKEAQSLRRRGTP